MLLQLIFSFYDFCGFWSIAVNSVDKLQLFYINNSKNYFLETFTNLEYVYYCGKAYCEVKNSEIITRMRGSAIRSVRSQW